MKPHHPPTTYKSFRTWKKKPQQSFKSYNRRRNVCGACIVHKDHLLLVKQREMQKWGFPKGSREWQESKLSCMTRELLEETGIDLKQYQHTFLGVRTFFESTIYFYEISNDVPSMISVCPSDTKEIEESKWIPLDCIKNLELNRVTNHIKRLVFLKLSSSDWKTTLIQLCQQKKKTSNPVLDTSPPLTDVISSSVIPVTPTVVTTDVGLQPVAT